MFRTVPVSIITHNNGICHTDLLTAVSKPVEFYWKSKFKKLVHLVGFIIRIYHNARSPERQTKKHVFWYQDILIVRFLCVAKRNIRAPRPNILF
jgi:hypothetical protein